MNNYQYRDYNEYLEYQKKTAMADSTGQWSKRNEIEFLSLNLEGAKNGICHGVKSGAEAKWFREFTGADVIGTDIVPQSSEVLQWDFNEVKPEWIDKFDFIYSNAYDHTCVPDLCLKRWMSCLKQNGKLILEWTTAHVPSDPYNPFGATLSEYGEMIFRCGFKPKEVLKIDTPYNPIGEKHFIVVEHKKEFVILCDGGLGNRIGVLLGGMVMARQLDMEPVICWPANSWCGCYFRDLFNTDLKVLELGIRELYEAKKDHTFMIHANQTGANFQHEVPISPEGLDKIRANNCNVVYFNDSVPRFIDNAQATNVLDAFPIEHTLFNRAAAFVSQNGINDKVMGVHIRKTDGGQRINEKNLEMYIRNHQGIRVFLCSDDPETERRFKELPGVVVFPKTQYPEKLEEGDWNKEIVDADGRGFRCNVKRSRESIIEAFIDLLILSNTTISHGSGSTFFQLAKRYEHKRRVSCR
jgi:hypothetical protein